MMAGPILLLIQRTENDEDPTAVFPLSAYEAQTQIAALEAQAISMEKQLIIICSFKDWPKVEPGEEKDDDA